MSEMLITITQALQLVALAPTIFVVAFLMVITRADGRNVVPVLYFLSLGAGFVYNLLPIWYGDEGGVWLKGGLLLAAYSLPALSFLLVMQFLQAKMPPPMYWLILLVPLLGGSPFIYTTLIASDVCLDNRLCLVTEDLRQLYYVVSSSVIFLFLTVLFFRKHSALAINEADYVHRYWMVVAILLLNLLVIGLNLAELSGKLSGQDAVFLTTVVHVGFIYLILTSIFRLFYDVFNVAISPSSKERGVRNPDQDKRSVEELNRLLDQGIYREMSLSREQVGKKLGLSEQQISRIVNTYLGKNFNELINDRRISEAKERLKMEDTQITVIAFEVGFSSIASFNRVFKEATGASPTAYRSFHKHSVK